MYVCYIGVSSLRSGKVSVFQARQLQSYLQTHTGTLACLALYKSVISLEAKGSIYIFKTVTN